MWAACGEGPCGLSAHLPVVGCLGPLVSGLMPWGVICPKLSVCTCSPDPPPPPTTPLPRTGEATAPPPRWSVIKPLP
eukprot:scaffold3204_cov97-Isochrysis_galbana.AAC.3